MERLILEIKGRPVPWARAIPLGGRARLTKEQRTYRKLIKDTAGYCMNLQGFRKILAPGRVRLEFVASVDSPTVAGSGGGLGGGDASNYQKMIEDALKDVAFTDDGQIDCGQFCVRRGVPHDKTGLLIIIGECEDMEHAHR